MIRDIVEIAIDGDGVFYPGDVVRGTVTVTVFAPMACRQVEAQLMWRTTAEQKVTAVLELARDEEWEQGQHAFDFAFEMPDGPVTYHGQHLDLDWYVRAIAETSSKTAVRRRIELCPAPPALAAGGGYRDSKLQHVQHSLGRPKSKPQRLAALVPVVIAGLAAIAFLDHVTLQAAIVATVLTLAALLVGVGTVAYKALARRALGDVVVTLSPAEVRAGERLEIACAIAPPKELRLTTARFTLRCTEVATRTRKGRASMVTQPVRPQVVELCPEPSFIRAGETFNVSGGMTIPQGAPPTFRGEHDGVRWELKAAIGSAYYPKHRESFEIDVQPS